MVSVAGHVEDKEGRLSADEFFIVGDSSEELAQGGRTFTFTIYSGAHKNAVRCSLSCIVRARINMMKVWVNRFQ